MVTLHKKWAYLFISSDSIMLITRSAITVTVVGEGVSPFPCLDTWPGDRAFSEPSTQIMSRYINANKDNMIMLISMHSFTQLWLVPYAYEWDAYPPDYNDLVRISVCIFFLGL